LLQVTRYCDTISSGELFFWGIAMPFAAYACFLLMCTSWEPAVGCYLRQESDNVANPTRELQPVARYRTALTDALKSNKFSFSAAISAAEQCIEACNGAFADQNTPSNVKREVWAIKAQALFIKETLTFMQQLTVSYGFGDIPGQAGAQQFLYGRRLTERLNRDNQKLRNIMSEAERLYPGEFRNLNKSVLERESLHTRGVLRR
jgi:hypothetical protein